MPRNPTYNELPDDLPGVISALKYHIGWAERLAKDFQKRHYNAKREKAVIYCHLRALDLAKGSLACAEAALPDSLTLLCRALLETLFWARYVTLSKENAQAFEDATTAQLKRSARKNLAAGYARVVDTSTQEDRTAEFLDSVTMKGIPKRVRIEDAAEAGGLGRLYTNVYGFISMYAHGTAFGLLPDSETPSQVYASASTALGTLECINLLASEWIVNRRITDASTLTRLLGV
jgi:hypothetical protein